MPDIVVLDLSESAAELNRGIEEASSAYLAFAEEGARYSGDYFENLASALLECGQDCCIAQGLVRTHRKKVLTTQRGLTAEPEVLDAEADFRRVNLHPDGMLVKTSFLQECGVRFDEGFEFCRNELFALQLCHAHPRRLYVPKQKYRVKRVLDETGNNTAQSHEKGWYLESTLPLLDALQQGTEDARAPLPRYLQYALVYLTIRRFESNLNRIAKMVFADNDECEEYLQQVGDVLRHVDDEVLFCRNVALSMPAHRRLYLAKLRNGGTDPEYVIHTAEDDALLYIDGSGDPVRGTGVVASFKSQGVCVQTLRFERDASGAPGFYMDVRVISCFPDGSYDIYLSNVYDGEEHPVKAEATKRLGGLEAFFDHEVFVFSSFRVFVPLAPGSREQRIEAFGVVDGVKIPLKVTIWSSWQSRLWEGERTAYWSIPGYLVKSYDRALHVIPTSRLGKMKAELSFLRKLRRGNDTQRKFAKLRMAYWATRPYFKAKRIWVYYDKGFKGGDNADYAFRYAQSVKDGITKVYYIDPESVDGKAMEREGLFTLAPKSLKGLLYALNAEVIFSTHVPPFHRVGLEKSQLPYVKGIVDPKVVRMYHGFPITRDVSYTQFYSDHFAVVVGSEYERDLYTGPDNGFEADQVVDSGMPRYDDLVDEDCKQLLFAPTWRPALRGKVSADKSSQYNPDFKDSRYCRLYTQVMNDPRLLDACRRNGYKIKMFLHPRLAVQSVDFAGNDVIEALDCTKDMDYVTIMRKSSLMVTDYSSVMFDFAYMRKPVVYYQDPALPYWRIVDFDYEGIGFGEVCKSAEELVNVLVSYVENGCALSEGYRERIERFFVHDDRNSSKRLYERVKEMVEEVRRG